MNLQASLKAPIYTDVSLKLYTTFKIGGCSKYFAEPRTRSELLSALEFREERGVPLLILGRGSNLLFSDAGYPGLVLSTRKLEIGQMTNLGRGRIRVPAGLGLIRLNLYCKDQGLSGAEFLCHIPGTVGGAVVMNAGFRRRGAPWHEMKDIIESVTVMSFGGTLRELTHRDIRFDYRKTNLGGEDIITEVTLHLESAERQKIDDEIKANFSYRNSVQDLRYPSAGSVFKNPVGSSLTAQDAPSLPGASGAVPARGMKPRAGGRAKQGPLTSGQMLERVRMKGMRVGDAMVSTKHANFILNVGQAKSSDVLELMSIAKKRVLEQFGIELEPEIRYVPSEIDETVN